MSKKMIRNGIFNPDEYEEEKTPTTNNEYTKEDWLWLENQKV